MSDERAADGYRQCTFCEGWFPPESTRLHPFVSGNPPLATGRIYRRCIDCTEHVLKNTDTELRRLVGLWERE